MDHVETACPGCGWKVTPDYLNNVMRDHRLREERNLKVGCGTLLVFAIIGMIAFCSQDSSNSTSVAQRSGDPSTAYLMSQEFVTDRLKAPSTADYPWYDDRFVQTIGEGRYRVSAFVDAQNGFGAMIRSEYTCVQSTKDGSKWTLENIHIRSR